MSRPIGTTSWLAELDGTSPEPLHRQLYASLREGILDGRLAPGSRLPSSRTLQAELGVARNTVLAAFDQLLAEGYLVGRLGSGTYVARILPEELMTAGQGRRHGQPGARSPAHLSRAGRAALSIPVTGDPSGTGAFVFWLPAVDRFPFATWSRLTARRWDRPAPGLLDYGDAAGYGPLRASIAAHLNTARALSCSPDQIVITGGAQHALSLLARLLVDPGEEVWLEDPGYLGARTAFVAAGASIVPVPVDHDGLDVSEGRHRAPAARLAYVTPSHQFPLGVTMSLGRRLALLEWAAQERRWIVEDDYDSEFRFAGRPLGSLQGMDQAGRVIYLGTFSKVLFPSLRLGYVVLPVELVKPFVALRTWDDHHSPTMDQAVLADFIAEGHFARHLRRMRALYEHRQEVLLGAGEAHLGSLLEVQPGTGGMHTVAWLPEGSDERAAAAAARSHGVAAAPLGAYASGGSIRPGFVLGYAGFDDAEIENAAKRLAAALREGS